MKMDQGQLVLAGQRIKECRLLNGERQQDIGDLVGVHKSTIGRWENGNTAKLSLIIINILAKHFNVNPAWLAGKDVCKKQGKIVELKKSVSIPILGKIAAGVPIEAVTDILGYEEISEERAREEDYFALTIRGDSMYPLLFDGDVVIVRAQPDCESGDIAVIIVDGKDATVKRIKKRPEGIMLVPANPSYEPMFYANSYVTDMSVSILGKVVELRRKL